VSKWSCVAFKISIFKNKQNSKQVWHERPNYLFGHVMLPSGAVVQINRV